MPETCMPPVRTRSAVWVTPSGTSDDHAAFELKDRMHQDRILYSISEYAMRGNVREAEREADYLVNQYGHKYNTSLMRMILGDYMKLARTRHRSSERI